MATVDRTTSLATDPISGFANIAFQRIRRHIACAPSPAALTFATHAREIIKRDRQLPCECVCQFNCVDKRVHLCTDCRIEQRRRELSRVLGRIQAETQLEHMHAGDDDDYDWEDCTNIEHFIRPHGNGPRGESGCLCALDDVQKLKTYIGGRHGEANLCETVRFCVQCWREMLVAMRPD
jgi:hypothetical protein